MSAGADQGSAAGFAPFARHGTGRALQAFFALHKQKLALFGAQDLGSFLYGSGIDKVFCIHEFFAGFSYCLLEKLHFFHAAGKHFAFGHGVADVFLTGLTKITGQRLFADHMFSGFQGIQRNACMQKRR